MLPMIQILYYSVIFRTDGYFCHSITAPALIAAQPQVLFCAVGCEFVQRARRGVRSWQALSAGSQSRRGGERDARRASMPCDGPDAGVPFYTAPTKRRQWLSVGVLDIPTGDGKPVHLAFRISAARTKEKPSTEGFSFGHKGLNPLRLNRLFWSACQGSFCCGLQHHAPG